MDQKVVEIVNLLVEEFWHLLSGQNSVLVEIVQKLDLVAERNTSLHESISEINHILQERIEGKTRGPRKPASPSPCVPKHVPDSPDLLEMHSLEVARQLTMMEWLLFSKVPISDFEHKRWEKKEKSSETLQDLISLTNRHILWVATEILSHDNEKKRASCIEKFISIGIHFKEINNWNGVMEIVSALNSSSITRLKQSWKVKRNSKKKRKKKLIFFMKENIKKVCREPERAGRGHEPGRKLQSLQVYFGEE